MGFPRLLAAIPLLAPDRSVAVHMVAAGTMRIIWRIDGYSLGHFRGW